MSVTLNVYPLLLRSRAMMIFCPCKIRQNFESALSSATFGINVGISVMIVNDA